MSLCRKEEIELHELLEDEFLYNLENDLRIFVPEAFKIIEPHNKFVPGWHIDAICEHLQAVTNGQIRNLLINIPPRHMKSSIVSVIWPAWVWINKPHIKWLYSSYAERLSIRDSTKCRRIIQSPWYQKLYGDRYHLAYDQNQKLRFDNNKSGYRIASSVGGSNTGEGGDIIVADDPNNIKEIYSDVKRESVVTWWFEVMSTRLNDPKTSSKVVIMQRCHEGDLSGEILEREDFEHLCLPAEFEHDDQKTSIGFVDPRKHEGELLWPERFGARELMLLKRSLGSMASAGQLQQKPAPDEGTYLKKIWWKFYDFKPKKFDEVIQSWDCSFKDEKDNDFVCGQVWGRVGADRYLLDQFKEKADIVKTLQAIINMTNKWPEAKIKVIEEKANGAAVIALLKRKITGLVPYNPGRDGKVERVIAVQPCIESGNVYLPSKRICKWDIDKFIINCAKFPAVKHDDDIDAMTQALIRFDSHQASEFPDQDEDDDTLAPSFSKNNLW